MQSIGSRGRRLFWLSVFEVDKFKAFLDYVSGKKPDDEFVNELEAAVNEAKRNREWRHEYMTLAMRDIENREKGREEGRQEGRQEGMEIMIEKLLQTTQSVTQTAMLLQMDEEKIREVARKENLVLNK